MTYFNSCYIENKFTANSTYEAVDNSLFEINSTQDNFYSTQKTRVDFS